MAGILKGVLKIGGSIISSGKKKSASKEAQAAYAAAQQQAIAQSRATQDAIEARLDPYSQSGRVGLDKLTSGIADGSLTRAFTANDFQADPGYAFRKEEGLRALDRTLAARGSLFSGAQIRGAQDYGQNIAAEEYDNAYNRFNVDQEKAYSRTANLANLGLSADTAIGSSLGSEGDQIRSSLIDIGGSDAASLRERGLISAQMWDNITNEAVSAIDSVASEGTSDVLKSLKAGLGTGTSVQTPGGGIGGGQPGTSAYSLSRIFGRR